MQKTFKKLSELKFYSDNFRNIDKKDMDRGKDQLVIFGQHTPLILDKETNIVLSGNMRLKAMQLLKWEEAWVSEVEFIKKDNNQFSVLIDGKPQSGEWENKESAMFALSLSANDRWGYYDQEAIQNNLGRFSIDSTKFSIDFVSPLNLSKVLLNIPIIQDVPPDLEDKAITVRGDVYEFVSNNLTHRLVCGDSTDADVYKKLFIGNEKAQLLLTDPPYNVAYTGGGKVKNRKKIENDNLKDDEFVSLISNCMNLAGSYLQGAYYCWMSYSELFNVAGIFRNLKMPVKNYITWVKDHHVLGGGDYQPQSESSIFGFNKNFIHQQIQNHEETENVEAENIAYGYNSHKFYGNRKQTVVWFCRKPNKSDDHPTMKPVRLFARCIANNTKEGDIVLDNFAGSGTTLIACEQLNRSARLIELDAHYCDVMVRRFIKFMEGREFLIYRNGKKIDVKSFDI